MGYGGLVAPRPVRWWLIIAAVGLGFVLPVSPSDTRASSVTEGRVYCSFKDSCAKMRSWGGDEVVVLTRWEDRFEAEAMDRLVATLDRAWAAYAGLVGYEPESNPGFSLDGRVIIAQPADRDCCAAARGFIGRMGIELYGDHFRRVYDRFRHHGELDHIFLHEMGRNFWRFRPQLGELPAFEVGFAIANKFIVTDIAGLRGAPFHGIPWARFREGSLEETLDIYRARGWGWREAFVERRPLGHKDGWGANDLAGAFFFVIYSRSGRDGYRRFFDALARMPRADSAEKAVENFIEAARLGAGVDLRSLFPETMRRKTSD